MWKIIGGIVVVILIIIIGIIIFGGGSGGGKNEEEPTPEPNKPDEPVVPPKAIGPPIEATEKYYSPPTVSGFTTSVNDFASRPDIVLRDVEKERVIALPFPDETVFPAGHSSNSRLAMFMDLPVHPY